jgi:hypothetical protein
MSRVELNPDLEAMLTRTRVLEDPLKEAADDIRDEAKRIARAEAYDEGDYEDGIESEVVISDGIAGRVKALDFKSGWIEFGTVKQSPKAPLRRAGETRGRVKGGRS